MTNKSCKPPSGGRISIKGQAPNFCEMGTGYEGARMVKGHKYHNDPSNYIYGIGPAQIYLIVWLNFDDETIRR